MFQTAKRGRIFQWTVLILVCLTSGIGAEEEEGRPAPLSELLEQAIFAEESLGDLDRAIGIYREILSRAEAEQSLIAQAQLRLGLCHLKKGDENEAVAAFQKLVEDFPRQRELVAAARDRLAALGHAPPAEGVQLRQVWKEAKDILGSLSADGRYLSFTDWTTGDLALHDFKSGQDQRLTRKGSWATPAYAEFSLVSPDGRQVAYAWFKGMDVLYDLRVVATDGSEPRLLYSQQDTVWVQPVDWSPDGRRILTFLAKASGEQLAWISLDDGSVETVGPLREYPDGKIDLSPDGRQLVYDNATSEESAKRDILLIDVETGAEHTLVTHPADDRVLGWSPDGRWLLFASDRTGDWGAWSVRVADARTVGAPQLVKDRLGQLWPSGQLFPLGFTREGAFLYGVMSNFKDVYVVNVGAGAEPSAATKVARRFEGTNTSPDFSADGKRLAWLSQREDGFVIVIRDLETGGNREVEVSDRMRRIMRGGWGGMRWSPDGTSFLVCGMARPQEGWLGIFTIDAESGDVQQVTQADPDGALRMPAWAPDGRSVYFIRSGDVVVLNLESGEETTVLQKVDGNIALSPDGTQLAFTTNFYAGDRTHLLRVVPTAGGEAREIFRSQESEPFHTATPLTWTPDGRYVLVGTGAVAGSPADEAKLAVWRVPVDGSSSERLGVEMSHLLHLRVHPDGDRVAFEAGTRKPEIWRLENFLPGQSAGH